MEREKKFDSMITSLVKDLANCDDKPELLGKMECIKHMILLDLELNLKL